MWKARKLNELFFFFACHVNNIVTLAFYSLLPSSTFPFLFLCTAKLKKLWKKINSGLSKVACFFVFIGHFNSSILFCRCTVLIRNGVNSDRAPQLADPEFNFVNDSVTIRPRLTEAETAKDPTVTNKDANKNHVQVRKLTFAHFLFEI